jgi:hypothetical protein
MGEMLNELGYQVVPALDCQQAVSITTELNLKIDVLVVNPLPLAMVLSTTRRHGRTRPPEHQAWPPPLRTELAELGYEINNLKRNQ